MTGLRERKKQRTRDALIRVAHELFVGQGYEHTTVDQITAAVDVSQRTFFRYFASKEDVAFALQDEIESYFCEAVGAQPPDGSPMRALRGALEDTWESMGQVVHQVVSTSVHMRMWQVIETTPALIAVHMRRSSEMEDRLTEALAHRQGLPASDPRPRVLVASFSGVIRAAGRQWGETGEASLEAAQRMAGTYLDLMYPVLRDDWSQGHATAPEPGGARRPSPGTKPGTGAGPTPRT